MDSFVLRRWSVLGQQFCRRLCPLLNGRSYSSRKTSRDCFATGLENNKQTKLIMVPSPKTKELRPIKGPVKLEVLKSCKATVLNLLQLGHLCFNASNLVYLWPTPASLRCSTMMSSSWTSRITASLRINCSCSKDKILKFVKFQDWTTTNNYIVLLL